MTEKQNELKVYCFYWTNTRLGIRSVDGTIHYDIEKRMVIAINEKEAREALSNKDEELKEIMRQQLKDTRPDKEIEKLIESVFYKDGLSVREFLLEKDLVI